MLKQDHTAWEHRLAQPTKAKSQGVIFKRQLPFSLQQKGLYSMLMKIKLYRGVWASLRWSREQWEVLSKHHLAVMNGHLQRYRIQGQCDFLDTFTQNEFFFFLRERQDIVGQFIKKSPQGLHYLLINQSDSLSIFIVLVFSSKNILKTMNNFMHIEKMQVSNSTCV